MHIIILTGCASFTYDVTRKEEAANNNRSERNKYLPKMLVLIQD